MRLNSLNLMVALAVIGASSLCLSPIAKAADGAAPGEGAYLGAFLGFGTGILQAKVSALDASRGNPGVNNSNS